MTKPWGFTGQPVYMKSLMLRSSRAFLGGGGFLGLWATPGDIGAPGVAPLAGKPGLAMGIMGVPGLHRDRWKEKETVRHNVGYLMGARDT